MARNPVSTSATPVNIRKIRNAIKNTLPIALKISLKALPIFDVVLYPVLYKGALFV
jgi:hypothetical protein